MISFILSDVESFLSQWDYRDTTTPYDSTTQDYSPYGLPTPSVNSHYSRQTIWWAIPLALSGQQYDARSGELHLDVDPSLLRTPSSWPLLLPVGTILMQRDRSSEWQHNARFCAKLHVLSGHVNLRQLDIHITIRSEQIMLSHLRVIDLHAPRHTLADSLVMCAVSP